jgi:flagellum-specific peptidoglycan hydrolase FlgJ
MKKKILTFRGDCLTWTITKKTQLTTLLKQYGWRLMLALFFGTLLYQKDVQVQIGMDNTAFATMAAMVALRPIAAAEKITYAKASVAPPMAQKAVYKEEEVMLSSTTESKGFWSKSKPTTKSKSAKRTAPKAVKTKWKDDGTLANTYSNLTYTNPKFATKNTSSTVSKKRKKKLAYIERFVEIAQTEMKKYGVPASITLAQGLLESNVGESRLSTRNNNHFGMKCFSKSCGKGHCSNFTDDSHKDFFRKYGSAWESYRAHSKMLGGKRYRSLKKLGK